MRHLTTVIAVIVAITTAFSATASSALACAGLIGSNGSVNLGRTTTLAAYHDGVEHYVTAFQFLGGGGQFGTLIPLPGVPTSVERGGGWTLQRLKQETEPRRASLRLLEAPAAAGLADNVQILLETRVDALDITVLQGGPRAVAAWATDRGFRLSPEAPEMLDFYATRSPIFLAAVFDADAAAARGQQIGDGTPVQITIPTPNPWVPLRILTLGKQANDRVEADVYLLTDIKPAFLPEPSSGMSLVHDAAARDLLLNDLRSDDKMEWVPQAGWLTKLRIDSRAADLSYDLAVDASGQGTPSRLAAGLSSGHRTLLFQAFDVPTVLGLLLVLALPAAVAMRRRVWSR
jgi:hypothetical protein